MKTFFKVLLSAIACIAVSVCLAVGGFFIFYTPSLTADLSERTGSVTSGASGYLYGIAEQGVPSENMTESLDISSVSAKVTDGLQHPVGDISHVYSQLDNTDYNVVYLQDNYSTWYYEHKAIEQARADGSYDWKSFVENDYLPKVRASVETLSVAPYSDKVVYCLYNECDNGVWFGESKTNDEGYTYGEYNETGEQNFFEAWKMTYDLVKSINSNALTGGPGFCDYDSREIENFLAYCKENDCVPEIMIYHELGDYSVPFWQQHYSEYREMETKLGIPALPIIITEYGRMCDNGLPGKMVQYITQIETTKVYADNAYWRLADNLNDVAADDNSPNSNWWLFRWYADMEGQTVKSKYFDLFKSNFENAFIKKKAPYTSWGFMGLVSITDEEDRIDAVCGGRSGSAVVKLKNLNTTAFKGKKVCVTIEETIYKGLSGIVSAPVTKQIYYTDVKNTLSIDINDMEDCNAYHITVVPVDDDAAEEPYTSDRYIKRYEFEDAQLLGGAYLYNNWYACTGGNDSVADEMDIVGGIENEGDGVELTFSVPQDGAYDLNIIYGKANDGEPDENGRRNPDDRISAVAVMTLDGDESDISFANTIKSEYTDCKTLTLTLTKGEHKISFKHKSGTFVLDSLLVTDSREEEIAVLADADRSVDTVSSYLVVAPCDGFYELESSALSCKINDIAVSLSGKSNTIYLMRGLNYIDLDGADNIALKTSASGGKAYALEAKQASLDSGAVINHNDANNIDFITGISSSGGRAKFSVSADRAGSYALTILYSNNEEGGVHDYNVDLIERYATVTVNGKSQDVFCRNTYSRDTYKTVTCFIELNEGANDITLTNSGNVRFNNRTAYAPDISLLTVNEICA